MPDEDVEGRVNTLIGRAKVLAAADSSEQAFAALREANALDPDNAAVVQALRRSKTSEADDVTRLCAEFCEDGDAGALKRAMHLAKASHYDQQTAAALLENVFNAKPEVKERCVDFFEAVLLQKAGRAALRGLLRANLTGTFRHLWQLGDRSTDSLLRLCLTPEGWTDAADRTEVVRGLALLLLATLLRAGHERHETAMRALARLMSVDAPYLEDLFDTENLSIILSFIDADASIGLRSQATLITAKFLEASRERGQALLKDYVVVRVGKGNADDMAAGFSVAGAMFPIVPDIAATLFLTPGFLDDVIGTVQKLKSGRLRLAALELLSAACINKDCRLATRDKCSAWLNQTAADRTNASNAAMAALVLAKSGQDDGSAFASTEPNATEDLIDVFRDFTIRDQSLQLPTAIEGLAYCSMQSENKPRIADDVQFLKAIVSSIRKEEGTGPLAFGALTTISNLTTYPAQLTDEQKRMAQLKAYANQTKPTAPSPLESQTNVTARCKQVLNAGVLPALGSVVRHAPPTVLGLVATILLSLSRERSHCGIMVQAGVLNILFPLATYKGQDPALLAARKTASQALARTVTPIEPFLIFSNYQNSLKARPIADAIGAFKLLLDEPDSQDPRPAFEALQALTNLASMGAEVSESITKDAFASIERYLDATRSALQQAAVECVSNLSVCEVCIDLFVAEEGTKLHFPAALGGIEDAEHPHEARFLKLRSLAEDDVRGVRLAAMATLYNLTGDRAGVRMLCESPSGLRRLVGLLSLPEITNETGDKGKLDADMLTRTLGVLGNILQDEKNRKVCADLGLEQTLEKLNIKSEDEELASFQQEALKLLRE